MRFVKQKVGQVAIAVTITFFLMFAFAYAAVAPDNISGKWAAFAKDPSVYDVNGNYPYMESFKKYSEDFKIPLLMLLSVARGESNFDPNAIGRAKNGKPIAYGIMQINYATTAQELGYGKGESPEVLMQDTDRNIKAGAKYLRKMLDKFNDDYYLAVSAYNWGPGNVERGTYKDGYAKYIFRHLQKVSEQLYDPKVKYCVIREFTFFDTAVDMLPRFSSAVPGIKLEIFKCNYFYYLTFAYNTESEKRTLANKIIKKKGFIKSRPEGCENCTGFTFF